MLSLATRRDGTCSSIGRLRTVHQKRQPKFLPLHLGIYASQLSSPTRIVHGKLLPQARNFWFSQRRVPHYWGAADGPCKQQCDKQKSSAWKAQKFSFPAFKLAANAEVHISNGFTNNVIVPYYKCGWRLSRFTVNPWVGLNTWHLFRIYSYF